MFQQEEEKDLSRERDSPPLYKNKELDMGKKDNLLERAADDQLKTKDSLKRKTRKQRNMERKRTPRDKDKAGESIRKSKSLRDRDKSDGNIRKGISLRYKSKDRMSGSIREEGSRRGKDKNDDNMRKKKIQGDETMNLEKENNKEDIKINL